MVGLDLALKFVCVYLLHLVVSPDLKAALELIRYLKSPMKIEHITASRFLCTTVLSFKFIAGLATESFFILCLSRIEEKADPQETGQLSSSALVLLTFVIFAVVYEVPNLFFKSRIGLGDA